MNLKFEVENMIIRQKKSSNHQQNNLDNLFCSFVFTSPEWKFIEKYAIFWSRKGKSTIRYIGKGTKGQCEIPQMILNDLHFYIQVYANDDVKTQKLKVFTLQDIPTQKKHGYHEKNNLNDFFLQMEKKIDNIIYDDGKLLVYSNNRLIRSIDIVDDKLMARIISNIAPQLIVNIAISPDSDLPVSSKLVYHALQDKVDIASLSDIAFTGSYNDLIDVPNEFQPLPHTHISEDIENWDETIEEDLDDFIDSLIEKL